MSTKRRTYSPQFKAKVALAALKNDEPIAELAAQDNIFIERLWWTLKYNYVYLRAFNNGADLREGLRGWFSFYNHERFHQALDNLTPDEVYYDLPRPFAEAA